MGAFEYRQAEEIRDAFKRHGIRYLFIGKSGAILLGFPDTTQDADVFVEKSMSNSRALATALKELGFDISPSEASEIERGKDFIQLKNGPFDLDLIFAPDGIERFSDAWHGHVNIDGFPVCHHLEQIRHEPPKGSGITSGPRSIPRVSSQASKRMTDSTGIRLI
jgi:hypothetical protein